MCQTYISFSPNTFVWTEMHYLSTQCMFVNWNAFVQPQCIYTSRNACSDQVFATLSMLYLQIAPWACNALDISPVHIIAHCTNHTAHCTAAFWHILHCMQGKLSMLHLQTTLWACQLHSFCDVHFTSVHCSMHNSHCAILGQNCANRTTHCISVWCKLYCREKLFSPLQRRTHDQQQTKCFLRWHLTGVV